MSEYTYDYLIKLILVGDSGVGKSTIMQMFCDDKFCEPYMSTIGVDFRIKMIKSNNKTVKLQIWDTAGQEKFKSITTSYYRGANAIMLVFDLTNVYSFRRLENWIKELEKYLEGSDYYLLLIGNKQDMEVQRRISIEEINMFTEKYKLPYFEISAKTSKNINIAFDQIIEKCVQKNLHKFVTVDEPTKIESIPFIETKPKKEKKCCN